MMKKFIEGLFWIAAGGVVVWIGSRHNAMSLMILGWLVIVCALWPLVPKSADDLHIKP